MKIINKRELINFFKKNLVLVTFVYGVIYTALVLNGEGLFFGQYPLFHISISTTGRTETYYLDHGLEGIILSFVPFILVYGWQKFYKK